MDTVKTFFKRSLDINCQSADWMSVIFEIYSEMRQTGGGDSYRIEFDGLDVTVPPQVYAPQFFTDSSWFGRCLPEIVGPSTVLEIGCGTGFISIKCALSGATVFASDINPAAVESCRLNFERAGISARVQVSDVYDAWQGHRFDAIFWSHPFNNWPEPVDDYLLMTGLDYQYRSLARYILEADRVLAPHGRLLLGTGNTADLQSITELAARVGRTLTIIRAENLPIRQGSKDTITYLLVDLVRHSDPRLPK